MNKIDKETITKALHINALEYFSTKGYSITVEKGTKWKYKIKDLDIILRENLGIWCIYNYKEQKGYNIINFLLENGYKFPDAIKELTGIEKEKNIKINFKNLEYINNNNNDDDDFNLKNIIYDNTVKHTIAYLTKTRGLPYILVINLIKMKYIRQITNTDKNIHNILFVHYSCKNNGIGANEEVGGDIKGTMPNNKFRGVLSGTGQTGFNLEYYGSKKAGLQIDRIYIFESPIDLLSGIALFSNIIEENVLFLSMGGCKYGILDTYLTKNINQISFFGDNDKAGDETFEKIKQTYGDKYIIKDGRNFLRKANVKDFNELLLLKNNQKTA